MAGRTLRSSIGRETCNQLPVGRRSSGQPLVVAVGLIAVMLCVTAAVGRPKTAGSTITSQYFAAWKKEVLKIDSLLVAKDWKRANRRAEKLLDQFSYHLMTGGREFIGAVVLERAVALAGLGKEHDAEWYAWMASDFWDRSADQLLRYGDIGLRLRRALSGMGQGDGNAQPVVVDDGEGAVVLYPDELRAAAGDLVFREGMDTQGSQLTPPVIISKRQPQYPEGVRWARGEDTIQIMTMIGRDGVPRSPTIVRSSSYVPMVYMALDALKDWRFKPATENGKPIDALYVLTVRFMLTRQ